MPTTRYSRQSGDKVDATISAVVNHDGRYLDDAQAPGVGDALVGISQTLLQAGAAGLQTLLCQSCRLLRIGGQISGQYRFQLFCRIQQNQAIRGTLYGMLAVGDDHRWWRVRVLSQWSAGTARSGLGTGGSDRERT